MFIYAFYDAYIYIYTCMYKTNKHTYIHTYIHTVHTDRQTDIHACMHTYIHNDLIYKRQHTMVPLDGFRDKFHAGLPGKDPSEATEAFLCASDEMSGTSQFCYEHVENFMEILLV